MSTRIGIIGGSGLDNPDLFEPVSTQDRENSQGRPSSPLRIGRLRDTDVELVLLSRHGIGHTIPPHKVNHRANITALKEAGCAAVIATTACGSLREDLHPGSIVVPDQFIDFTRNPVTFLDSFADGVVHPAMADPFSSVVRSALLAAADECGIAARDGGCVVSIAGPRFSTRAESRMFRILGCDIINMTVAPECILAFEADLPYAAIAMVTDYDSWDANRPEVRLEDIFRVMHENVERVLKILVCAFPKLAADLQD